MSTPAPVLDVIVVGAGIMGASAAYYIAKEKRSVMLLEQFDFLHRRGSSHGDSRIIRYTYVQDYFVRMMVLQGLLNCVQSLKRD
jgi:sarcosine oxidase/L-pipecolate oxidase